MPITTGRLKSLRLFSTPPLGIYLLATWTETSTFFIGLAIGIDLVFDGAALVGFAGAIHSLPKVQSRTA